VATDMGMSTKLAVVVAITLGVSGCSVLQDWGIINGPDAAVEEAAAEAPTEEESVEADETVVEPVPVEAGLSVPTCDTIYSSDLAAELTSQERSNVGDTSEGDFGYGTTNQDLVNQLKNVRSDLRISCTWYLPASESVSVTSVAIVTGEVLDDVERVLSSMGAGSAEAGGGAFFTIDSATSDESPGYIATEAHFLTEVTCPASLAGESCGVWVSTNYAYGQARPLTLDAARTLGVYEN
jgi:hypothetical protein